MFVIYDIIISKNKRFLELSRLLNFKNHNVLFKKYSFLGLNSFLQLIAISLPQLIIERFLGLEILSFVGIVMLFNSAFDTVYLSSINSLRKSYSELVNYKEGLKKFIKKIISLFIIYLVSLLSIFNFIGDTLFSIYNQNFSFQIEVMTLVLLGSFLFYTANVINFEYFVNREVIEIFRLLFARALCTALLSYYFVIEFKEYSFGLIYFCSNLIYLLYSLKNKRKTTKK